MGQTPLGAGVREVDTGPIQDIDVGESVVHRHVSDVAPPPEQHKRAHALDLNRSSLRNAILLKEILDKPIALREDDPGPGW